MPREQGAHGFSQRYWKDNYSCLKEMDGVANATGHALYCKSFLELEQISVDSVIDFGFGLGHLFEAFLRILRPRRAEGIEPSPSAFQKVSSRQIAPSARTSLKLRPLDLVAWAEHISKLKRRPRRFELGICTSVFQYLSQKQIELVLPVMAQQVHYLYFSVPTVTEIERQEREFHFRDAYAFERDQSTYLKWLSPHFTVVGCRILESKYYFTTDNTVCSDHLFRF